MLKNKSQLPDATQALPGRDTPMPLPQRHYVLDAPLAPPFPDHTEQIVFGMGCFWGAEKVFWSLPGVYTTAVGYSAGITPNPVYEEVCSGMTGHNEVVLVVYDSRAIAFASLLKVFWESHDPTQGMRQGNDRGTQYRSGVYFHSDAQKALAESTRQEYQRELGSQGHGEITTEVMRAGEFYYAEEYHQQYLAKNPQGYCGLGGTGVTLAVV